MTAPTVVPPVSGSTEAGPPPRNPQPRSWTDRLLALWGLLVLVFLFAPIVVVVIYSFNEGRLLIAWDHFGFGSYTGLLDRPAIVSAVKVSLQVAVLSGVEEVVEPDFEQVRAKFVAELVFACAYEPELGEVAELVATSRTKVAGLRLVEAAAFLVTDLDGGVAVLFGRTKVGHVTGANLNGGRATEPSPVIKDLDGTELSAKESFDSHVVTA